MKINNRIKSIKDVEIETPTICYSCGKEISAGKMWKITYYNYLDSKIDPCYCCKKCMPNQSEVIKTFGISLQKIDDKDDTSTVFKLNDLLEMFIVILKIKEQKSFNPEILNELIYQKIKNKEYQELLMGYNKKKLFENIKDLINSGYLYSTIKEGNLTLHINNKIPITKLMKKNINYLEPMINFTEEYQTKEKAIYSSALYLEMKNINNNNFLYNKKRKNV